MDPTEKSGSTTLHCLSSGPTKRISLSLSLFLTNINTVLLMTVSLSPLVEKYVFIQLCWTANLHSVKVTDIGKTCSQIIHIYFFVCPVCPYVCVSVCLFATRLATQAYQFIFRLHFSMDFFARKFKKVELFFCFFLLFFV